MRGGTLVFAATTALLCGAVALLLRENRRLKGEIAGLVHTSACAAGLAEGDVLAPFALHDAGGNEVRFDFAGEHVGTVLFFHAGVCDACAETRVFWRQAPERAARPDVRVLCIQTDVLEGPPAQLEGLPASLAVPLPPVGWLAALPAVPATLVADEHGRLTHARFERLDPPSAEQLTAALLGLGSGRR